MKRMVISATVLAFVLSFNGFLFAKEDSSPDLSYPEVAADVLWVRPLGVVHIATGATAFVVSLPVAIPLRKAGEAKEFLITYPYYYYLKRPLRKM